MGQEVDPNLIELLIREVLEEKIASMIYNSEFFPTEPTIPKPSAETQPQQPPLPSPRKSLEFLEQQKEQPVVFEVPTPVPTPSPPRSPVPQPQQQQQKPAEPKPQVVQAPQPPPPVQYLVLEQEEEFSELDVTLEDQQPFEDDGKFLRTYFIEGLVFKIY